MHFEKFTANNTKKLYNFSWQSLRQVRDALMNVIVMQVIKLKQ